MPDITKIILLLNDVPLVGASVVVGEIGGLLKETDEDGAVAFPEIDSGTWFTEIWISHASIATSRQVIVAGETLTIDLGGYP
jgi:hypothetical protein